MVHLGLRRWRRWTRFSFFQGSHQGLSVKTCSSYIISTRPRSIESFLSTLSRVKAWPRALATSHVKKHPETEFLTDSMFKNLWHLEDNPYPQAKQDLTCGMLQTDTTLSASNHPAPPSPYFQRRILPGHTIKMYGTFMENRTNSYIWLSLKHFQTDG